MMKKIFVTLIMVVFFNLPIFSQVVSAVGMGTNIPDQSSVLELNSTNQGFLLPRLTTNQRDGIQKPAVGLTIYNKETNCIESFTGEEWIGNCGTPKAKIDILNCDNDVVISGSFKEGQSTGNTSLFIRLNVEKKGVYNINVAPKPDNGYYYNLSGTFSSTGPVEFTVAGVGSPKAERTAANPDKVYVTMNDVVSDCVKDIVVAPSAIPAAFTVTAGMSVGVGIVGSPLNSSNNYITVILTGNVVAFGSTYTIPEVTVDGMTFGPASGTFTQSPQTVTLSGRGTPVKGGTFSVAVSTNSTITTAPVTVNYTVAVPTLKIYDFNGGGYGSSAGAAQALLTSTANFGTLSSSIVKAQGFTFTDTSNMTSAVAAKPDIIVVHYPYNMSLADATTLKGYLNDGGVVIYFSESNRSEISNNVATMLGYPTSPNPFNDSDVTQQAQEKFNPVNDMIIKGPFGDLTGLQWTDDGGGGNGFGVYPAGSIVDYNTNNGKSRVWRSTAKNLFFVGDGGWLSQNRLSGTTPTTGNNSSYNSTLWGNIMAWAVKAVTTNGINYK
jgi:hypothetical protein